MKKPRSKIQNLLSLNYHRKRFGGSAIEYSTCDHDWQTMKSQTIHGDTIAYTHGADKNLQNHLNSLKNEFVGAPELNYHHALLIVLIRRGVNAQDNFKQFERLWNQEHQFLTTSLNTRWLTSACDTFIDHSQDEHLKALLMNAVILINTIKLQESERFLTKSSENLPNDERLHYLQQSRLSLFDGVSGFAVGTDDTLRNMRWRLDKLCQSHPLGIIVTTVFDRLQQPDSDTVYSRFRQAHSREKTSWWTN